MLDNAFRLYDNISEDSFERFEKTDEFEDYRTEFNPYLLCHYLQQNYVHYEMSYNLRLAKRYDTMSKFVSDKLSAKEFIILSEFVPSDVVNIIACYMPISEREFKLTRSLHFDLTRVFNDNAYVNGSRFIYSGSASIIPINTTKVIGEMPCYGFPMQSRENFHRHAFCAIHIQYDPELFWTTIGLMDFDGYFICPKTLHVICKK